MSSARTEPKRRPSRGSKRATRGAVTARARRWRARCRAVVGECAGPVTVRIFAPEFAGCDGAEAAQAVTAVLAGIDPALELAQVVLPAGFGELPAVVLEEDWTARHASEVHASVSKWAADFRRAMDRRLRRIPVIVGLDAYVTWPDGSKYRAVQTLAVIGARGLDGLVWKSMPLQGEYLVPGSNGRRAFRGLVSRNHARVELQGAPVLLLVCQDGIVFGKPRRQPNRGSRSREVRTAFQWKLVRERPAWAFHAIHTLPRKKGGKVPPSFTSSHNELRRRAVRVAAVAGLNSNKHLESCFDRIRQRLRCTEAYIDALVFD